jgi:uncharacterized protein (TIGR02453 family)
MEDSLMTTARSFAGFSPEGLRFLRGLAKHNNREWFTARKHIYETELLEPMRAMLSDATAAMKRAKIPLGADPKRSAFRIYRDIRFSPDKSPYKTNLGAYLSYDGGRETPGGLYIHVKPGESFMAVAFYQIEKPMLQRWRAEMARNPGRFQTMLGALKRNELDLSEPEDSLKRMPRGFEAYADSPIANYFRYPSFIASEELSDDDVESEDLVDRMVALAKRSKPLLDYGWSLI